MYKPYVLWIPDFDVTSGGIRVMWGLYGHLLAKGQIVFVNTQLPYMDTVAIYPEIATGNPLGGKTVVRYILNKPGVMSNGINPSPTEFDASDRLYYFSQLFGKAQDPNHYMFLPILNTHLFKDQGKKRTKRAYFVGKGVNTGIHPKDSVLIDRSLAQDQAYLADLLNECEVLYCYDPVTAMTEIARLCGCRVVMVNPTYSKDEFKKYEAGTNGITWGTEPTVPLDTGGFRKHYTDLKLQFGRKLDQFIEDTQK